MKTISIAPSSIARAANLTALLSLLVLAPARVPAATWLVTDLTDGAPNSLRDVAMQANPNDTVVFNVGGTLTLSLGPIVINKSLIIQGPGPTNLIITANGASRLFELNALTQITDLTLADGRHSSSGGGVFSAGGLVMSNCVIRDCTVVGPPGPDGNLDGTLDGFHGGSVQGGGIYCIGTMNKFLHCTFANNRAEGGQGGNGYSSLTRPSLAGHGGNGGYARGGAAFFEGEALFLSCTFSGNLAQGGSGGNGGMLGATSAGRNGGNGGDSHGGGVFAFSPLTMYSCTVVSNFAPRSLGGMRGGINLPGGPPLGGNNGNPGSSQGGGVAAQAFVVHNSILAGNQATFEPDCHTPLGVTSRGFNLVGNVGATTGFTGIGDQVGTPANPIDPRIGPLKDNGGPTPTHALQINSPAIDKGQSLDLNNSPYYCDQRFFPRPRNVDDSLVPNQVEGDGSDIGAYEFQPDILPRIVAIPPNPGKVCWPTEPDELYQLVCSEDIAKPFWLWSPVGSIVIGNGGEWCESILVPPLPSRKFFWVRAVKR